MTEIQAAAAPLTHQAPEHPSETSRAILGVVLAAQFVIPLSIAGTAVALPSIAHDLGASTTPLQWVVNGFNLAFALFTVVWGVVSDRIGYRAAFRIGVALASFASFASAVAPSLLLLDVFRFLAGTGAAAVLTAASAILSKTFTGSARGRAFALFGTINGLGLALGPTLSGLLVTAVGWQGVFVAHALILAATLAGTAVLPVISGQRPVAGRMVDFGLLRNRKFLALCLVPVAGAIGFVTLLTYLPGALGGIAAVTAGGGGAMMLAMTLPVLVAPVLATRLIQSSDRINPMGVIYVSLGCLVLGVAGMLALRPGVGPYAILLPMVLTGFGFGLPIGLVDGEALAAVPARSSGTAAGVLNLFRIGSEAMFVAGYSALLAWIIHRLTPDDGIADLIAAGNPGHPVTYAYAFEWAVLALLSLLLLTTAAVAVLHRTSSHNT